MNIASGKLPSGAKNVLFIGGLLLAVLGAPALLAYLCAALVTALDTGSLDLTPAIVGFSLVMLTGGAGAIVAWHSSKSLAWKPSQPIRVQTIWVWSGLFVFSLVSGWCVVQTRFIAPLFFPPALWMAAAAPPLLALAWFTGRPPDGFSWRRGLVAFVGGATVSAVIAVGLEVLLPALVLALVAGLAGAVLPGIAALLEALAGHSVATAIASPVFVLVFVQLAVVAPLAEEFAKPLITLPILGGLGRREAFLVAAMAGAGLATVENVAYASVGISLWTGILIVRAVGGAIHPLGAGLMGLGWHDVLRAEPGAWHKWAWRFGLAVGIHAIWNGGSVLAIALAEAKFSGQQPPAIDVLGVSAAGTTLALLVVSGLAALWLGRTIAQGIGAQADTTRSGARSSEAEFELSDRSLAIWALVCLAAIVPAGIAVLRLLMR